MFAAIAMRQAWLTCDRFRLMQAPTFAASGMNSLQSRIASGVQACWTSAETGCGWAGVRVAAIAGARSSSQRRLIAAPAPSRNEEDVVCRPFFIARPVLLMRGWWNSYPARTYGTGSFPVEVRPRKTGTEFPRESGKISRRKD